MQRCLPRPGPVVSGRGACQAGDRGGAGLNQAENRAQRVAGSIWMFIVRVTSNAVGPFSRYSPCFNRLDVLVVGGLLRGREILASESPGCDSGTRCVRFVTGPSVEGHAGCVLTRV